MKIYDRSLQKYIEEKESNQKSLNFLYKTVLGRILLKCIFARPYFSKLRSIYYHSQSSAKKIGPFIEEYSVDVSNWNPDNFKSFNDFFERKKEVQIDLSDGELPAVADSRLSAYRISDNLMVDVKHSIYSLEELLNSHIDLTEYNAGTCLVFRLSLEDYHRYIYPADGKLLKSYTVKGELHTVRPISNSYKVFSRNKRTVSVLSTKLFGEMIMIEVGAMLVGGIVNRNLNLFKKGEEKGHFEYGGSTIILLLKKAVSIDEDIIKQTKMGYETKVRIGSRIGEILHDGKSVGE